MNSPLARLLTQSTPALPILTYPGAKLIGANVLALVTQSETQTQAQLALADRYPLQALMTCMDLSVEAEAFGSAIHLAPDEVPTVTSRRVQSQADLDALEVPEVGAGRTQVYLDTARQLRQVAGDRLVLGGMVGPFSLASRLYGVSEALTLTLTEPEIMHALVAKATAFLKAYAAAFGEAGAHGVVMAEPTAGLLSPRWLGEFSSRYVREIVDTVQSDTFSVVLHNCAAKPVHLVPSLQSGAHGFHFGAPMDISKALTEAPSRAGILGNLDPSEVFVQGTPERIRRKTRELLQVAGKHPNFVISSGCDLPPTTPLAHLDAFFEALGEEAAA